MSEQKDSGPAFPNSASDARNKDGMSLRDWFAGMALQGMMLQGTQPNMAVHTNARFNSGKDSHYNYASAAFELADAMLAERNK